MHWIFKGEELLSLTSLHQRTWWLPQCLYNMFTATIHTWRPSALRYSNKGAHSTTIIFHVSQVWTYQNESRDKRGSSS